MRLQIQYPVFDQIQAAKDNGIPIMCDLRSDRMGDKVATLAYAMWIRDKADISVTMIEDSRGKTPFLLSDYVLPERISVMDIPAEKDITDMLDVHTSQNNDSLWIINGYLSIIGVHPVLKKPYPKKRTGEILFFPLTHTEYNQRRDMDLHCVALTVDYLKRRGHTVSVIYDRDTNILPVEHLPLNEVCERIYNASCIISGDTGFSHLAPALGTPVTAIYPDWYKYQSFSSFDQAKTAEWFGIPTWYTPKLFLPNSPYHLLRTVELDTEHKWSVEHVARSIDTLILWENDHDINGTESATSHVIQA
jgi:hypothetical protein